MSASIQSIPASYYANVTPGVISAGAGGVTLSELMLTTSWRPPIGAVLSFPTLAAVQAYFGPLSNEAMEAAVYFAGYSGATLTPGALLFVQYPTANVGAYLRGGNVSGLTLTQLQAISGVLDVTIDGTPETSSSINLSAATSFSNASAIITTALGLTGPTQGSGSGSFGGTFTATATGTTLVVTVLGANETIVPGTIASAMITGTGVPSNTFIVSQTLGSPGGNGTYITNQATTASSATITLGSNVLNVVVIASGVVAIGQEVTGSGVSSGTFITGLGTGTGGAGTYITSARQNVAPESGITFVIPTVSYDSLSGGFLVISSTNGASSTIGFGSGPAAAPLGLTQATGAVTSQGAIAGVPAANMAAVIATNANFSTFQTLFDPDAGSGNTQKQAFAAWVNSTNNQYAYICWDTDITPTESTDAATSMGQILKANGSSGTVLIYEPSGTNLHLGAFAGAYAASINFNATNGRATADYKSQSGLSPSALNVGVKANLIANGYNSYDGVATRGGAWQFFDPGSISGEFEWFDTYLNQIWLNSQCQVALMNMLTTFGSLPYTPRGYGIIRQVLTGGADGVSVSLPPASPVAAALNNGVINAGVPLSAEQAAFVNNLAGFPIDQFITTQGWYLIIQPATAQVRAARQSPTIILLYTDGGSIQRINLSSLVIQ